MLGSHTLRLATATATRRRLMLYVGEIKMCRRALGARVATGSVAGLLRGGGQSYDTPMTQRITIHCDCGTDIQATATDRTITCPDCESAFAVKLLPLSSEDDAPSYVHGTRTYRGP